MSASRSLEQKCGSGEGPQRAMSMVRGSICNAGGSTRAAPPVASCDTLANSSTVTGQVTGMGKPLSAGVATSLLRP